MAARNLNDRARATMREAGELGPDAKLTTESGRRSFAPGDRIYFMKNDAGLGVRNGTLGTIERIKGQSLAVRLDGEEGRRVMFGMQAYNHIDHGYAATIHKSQGVTVDQAHMLATPNFNRHLAYVAMTRHRDRLDVHWSKEEFGGRARLDRVLSREAAKDTSLDYEAAPVEREAADRPAAMQNRTVQGGNVRSFEQAANANETQPIPPITDRAKLEVERRAVKVRQRQETVAGRRAVVGERGGADAPTAERQARATIVHTAEIAAFDEETNRLAADMAQRHHLEQQGEEVARFELVLESAANWQEALLQPVERKARHAREQQQLHSFDDDKRRDAEQRPPSSRRLEP